jgi:hypothetical protein
VRPDPRAAAMSEDQLQESVRQYCAELGLAVQHIHDPRRCWLPGWPDLVIFGNGRTIYRELKSQYGTLKPDQRTVGYRIQQAGGNWKVWRPSDLLDGTISAELAEVAAVQPSLFGRTDSGPCYGAGCDHVSHRSEAG